MENEMHNLIKKAYDAFNARDIDSVFLFMSAEIEWPKAFEGGYVSGKAAIREYWTRQWTEINPLVLPLEINWREDGKLEVVVQQTVKDLKGHLMFDGKVKHIYTIEDGLLRRMDIESL